MHHAKRSSRAFPALLLACVACLWFGLPPAPGQQIWGTGANRFGQLGIGITPSPLQMTDVTEIAAGMWHTLALKNDGTVWAWGGNPEGELGDGSWLDRATPVQVVGLTDVVSISAGWFDSFAVKADGTVWAWGGNYYGELGDGTTTDRNVPVQVPGLADVVMISGVSTHTVALKRDGTVWTWGDNDYGQLGDGTTISRTTPAQVAGLSDVVAIAPGGSGFHSLVLKRDGTVWAWGRNAGGQLGDGTQTDRSTPAQVAGLPPIKAIAVGAHSLALDVNGTVWGWGDNANGELGDGTRIQRNTPVQAQRLSGVIWIAAGYWNSVVVTADHKAWSLTVAGPSRMDTPASIATAAIGYDHIVGCTTDGSVVVWGGNSFGAWGDGTMWCYYSPLEAADFSGIISVAAENNSLALRTDGTVWQWGSGFDRPTRVNSITRAIGIAAGWRHWLALATDGTVWAWGDNAVGELGDGSTQPWPWPVKVSGLAHVIEVAAGRNFSLALRGDGTLWAWGDNQYGTLGDGTTTNRLLPVQVAGSGYAAISAGLSHCLARKSDGTAWAWGLNADGQLGDGTQQNRSAPVQVLDLANVKQISAGDAHSLALLDDGSVWAWGDGSRGEMGTGYWELSRTQPRQVNSPADDVVFISAGFRSSLAIKFDGTVLGWGANSTGELGVGTHGYVKAPAPVLVPDNVSAMAAGYGYSLFLTRCSLAGQPAPTDLAANPPALVLGETTTLSGIVEDPGAVDGGEPGGVSTWTEGGTPIIAWYTGGCGERLAGIGNSITVSPMRTTTYYARPMNVVTGCFGESCAMITVQVDPTRFDLNSDHHINNADVALFQSCLKGPGVDYGGSLLCKRIDTDKDNDVDQTDFAVLQRCIGWPDIPADPACIE